jgi:hypothetical protein
MRAEGMDQVVEHLPSKHKALSSSFQYAKKKRKEKKSKRKEMR